MKVLASTFDIPQVDRGAFDAQHELNKECERLRSYRPANIRLADVQRAFLAPCGDVTHHAGCDCHRRARRIDDQGEVIDYSTVPLPASPALTVESLRAHLARITYRPNFRFEVYLGRFEGPHIAIHARLDDANRPGQTVDVRIDSALPPMHSVEQFERWLLWRLQIVESHECREWLRCDGAIVADPHAPDAQHDR